jgi:hypothetical protein
MVCCGLAMLCFCGWELRKLVRDIVGSQNSSSTDSWLSFGQLSRSHQNLLDELAQPAQPTPTPAFWQGRGSSAGAGGGADAGGVAMINLSEPFLPGDPLVDPDSGTKGSMEKRGKLWKQGQGSAGGNMLGRANWKEREFVLTANPTQLSYFDKVLGGIVVRDCFATVEMWRSSPMNARDCIFDGVRNVPKKVERLLHSQKTGTSGSTEWRFAVTCGSRTLKLAANSEGEMHEWIDALSKVLGGSVGNMSERQYNAPTPPRAPVIRAQVVQAHVVQAQVVQAQVVQVQVSHGRDRGGGDG